MSSRRASSDERTYCYRITASALDNIPAGSFVIDYEDGPEDWGPRRDWSLWHAASGEFRDGWTGVRPDRLCTTCRRSHSKAALHGHEGECGDAAPYLPPTED